MTLRDNFEAALFDKDGTTPFKMDDKDLTVKNAAIEALLSSYSVQIFPDEKPDGIESAKRYAIYEKLRDDKYDTVTAEDIVKIKNLVGKRFPPIIVGQFYKIIERKDT